jgi:hypothetical protein
MILGAFGLFAMHDVGVAALALHLGLFAMLAAALTDREFLPDSALRRRPR